MSNIATRLAGPCIIGYKGASFYSKASVPLSLGNETFTVGTNRHGPLEQRSRSKIASVKFTPIGNWANLAVLWPFTNIITGQLTTPVKSWDATVGGVDVTADSIACVAHGFADGTAVRLFALGTLPAGITAGTLYYLHAIDANSFSLHDTRAHAIANTNKVDITVVGTGIGRVIEQEPLTILTTENELYTFHVAAIGAMPSIKGTSTETLIGEVTFDLFRIAGTAATDDNSLYTRTFAPYADIEITNASILTQPYTVTWGSAPWSALDTLDGISWEFPMTTADMGDDRNGPQAKRITEVSVTVKCTPLGVDPGDVMAKLKLQGTGAQVGARLATADNFVMAGTGVTVTAYSAGLLTADQAFDPEADRVGELTWFGTRTFTGAVTNPTFAVAA